MNASTQTENAGQNCSYCKGKITPENIHLPRIDYRETEILNQRQQIHYLELDLAEKNAKLKAFENELHDLKSREKMNEINFSLVKKHNIELLEQIKSLIESKQPRKSTRLTNNDSLFVVKSLSSDVSKSKRNSEVDGKQSLVDSPQIDSKKESSSVNKKKLHYCQKCKRKFLNLSSLKIHTKYFHKDQKRMNNQVDQLFKSKSSTPSKCELCNKIFCNKYKIKRHIATVHEKNTKFRCHICEKCFSHSNGLSDHIIAVHEKLKPHKCSFCDKSFTQKSSLKTHVDAVHKKLRKHVCQICNKRFSHKSDLNRHMKLNH